MANTLFGTDGIRGVAGVRPLDPITMVLLGKAVAKIFKDSSSSGSPRQINVNKFQSDGKNRLQSIGEAKRRKRILIGKDTRLSGYMIEDAITSGLLMMGCDVFLVGPLPTPGVAYLTRSMRVDAGIMISASHNPYEDNGVKIFGSDGFKLPDEMEDKIERLIQDPELANLGASSSEIGRASRIDDAVGRYTVYLKNIVPRQVGFDGMRIGIDTANGAGYMVAPKVFSELGAEIVLRGNQPNGRNINAGFGSLYPNVVKNLVTEQSLDLGVTIDGDADRVLFVDEKGGLVDGDMILALCAIDLAERGELTGNRVVGTVMSNIGLDRFLDPHNISVLRSNVGDRYVLEEMLKNGIVLGGEQSGHMIHLSHSTSGDALLTAMMIASLMVRKQKPLSELMAGFERFPQQLVNVSVSSKPPLESLERVQKSIKEVTDEIKDKGQVLVRYSGTENKLRIMVQYHDSEKCEEYVNRIVEAVELDL